MLISGIVVAIIGVLVFTEFIPDPDSFKIESTKEIQWKQYLVYSIRPTMMLVFIEFIAFYLLKQYRTLIDDYKYFHSIFLLRLDNSVIFKIIDDKDLAETDKKELIDVLNSRTDKLNSLTYNDALRRTDNTNALLSKTKDLTELIKLVKGV